MFRFAFKGSPTLSRFNPYRPILENSSKNFLEISVFLGNESDRFLENPSIFGWAFQKSVCFKTRNSYILNSLFWISFPAISVFVKLIPIILQSTIGWVFQKSLRATIWVWNKLNRNGKLMDDLHGWVFGTFCGWVFQDWPIRVKGTIPSRVLVRNGGTVVIY